MTRQPDAPRHVVANAGDADTVLRRLTRDGWVARDGFALPDPAWDVTGSRLVLHGRIGDPDTLQLAVLAAARGAGIVAVCDVESPLGRALIDDLARLGPVQHGAAEPVDGNNAVADLVPEQRALLDRLAAGDTIAAAAAAEFLSLRTANRRIAEARALFGVRTTREAVLAYLRQRGAPPRSH
ncbi:LuxR family transcriptional regulator [Paractinoplanes lichenicola]|uniref:LuxR family transcriptional regulator n=1 Tax=Paractinoplanes lichenicola TaxID=2802976 RepID=A0ABS1VTN1_9ACTN|nr:LuxR family transcriptional regulator [Actinoplanes lichenicola]MBL7257821.1 LuxR family transcriptional regulator [Actinoplanes lichenicola]